MDNELTRLSDSELLRLMVQNHDDRCCYYLLFNRYKRDFEAISYEMGFNEPKKDCLSDLLMDFFFKLRGTSAQPPYSTCQKIKDPQKLHGWLMTAYHNFLSDRIKQWTKKHDLELKISEEEEENRDWHQRIYNDKDLRNIIRLFERVNVSFNAKERFIFFYDNCKMNDIYLCSEEEIQDELGISNENFRVIRHRIKDKIKELLKEIEDDIK